MDKFLGKKLDGRYEIHEFIGMGGMALVYKAYDTIDDRYVAIKILKDEYSKNEEFLRRFKNESKAIAMLSHPNIVQIYNVSFGNIIQYIVMEYVQGITLKEYLEQQTVINWKEAIYFIMQILKALQHAHEKGIIHRDIKPHNIMLLQDGTIKVTDFGIARFARSETRTMTDKAIGSVHYIAPEQARGDLTDAKADIYSIGVMLYEMITGKLPFDADSAVSVAIMQLQTDPEPPCNINPSIPKGLEEITLKAMQKEPSKRYRSAQQMLENLQEFKANPNMIFDYDYSFDDYSDYIENNLKPRGKSNKRQPDLSKSRQPKSRNNSKKKNKNSNKKILACVVGGLVLLIIAVLAYKFLSVTDVELPNFIGQKYNDVISDRGKGKYKFKFVKQDGYDIKKADGEILDQNPKPTNGKKVKSNTTITLTVNKLGDTFAMPDVTGKTKESAMNTLKEAGLNPTSVDVVDDNTAKGLVVSTDPAANAAVRASSPVTVYVSSGKSETKVQVPNVINQSYDSAKKKIESAGLKVGTITKKDSSKDEGTVLETDPLPSTSVKSGTAVNLTVSTGKNSGNSVDINVQLPAGVDKDLNLKVYIDGKLDSSFNRTVNPSKSDYTSLKVTGNSGQSTITVELDGKLYYTYVVDFDKSTIISSTKNPDY